MPALVCSAQSCAYNNAMYCGRDDIKIDGETFDQKYYYRHEKTGKKIALPPILCYYRFIGFSCRTGGNMKKRKTLQDLTIKDNFLFGAVMSVEENCRGFLEMVLGFPIAKVVVSKEKSIVYHPEYRGVRLDIYAEDEHRTHYNVEMQVRKKKALGKRSRYYHSQMVTDAVRSF